MSLSDRSIVRAPGERRGQAVEVESSAAWWRLAISIVLGTIGSVGIWSFVVALPAVQAEFGAGRGEASLPYTLVMTGFAFGGVVMGRLADRFGIVAPAIGGALMLGLGYVLAGSAATLWQFALVHGLLIGVGSAATFGPMVADISHWFTRRRGLAVGLAASGNYLAGTVWPPLIEHAIRTQGWRWTHVAIGIVCVATMLPLALLLRRKPRADDEATSDAPEVTISAGLGVSPAALQALLVVAGLACCVAMSMPQVHIVAYCGDLGYGVARGAQMLSLMLGFGIISRVASGWIADRIGNAPTLLLGSTLQAAALALYFAFDGLTSLYVISIVFGLSQGGIIPS